jgi:hypothetical protein
MIRYVLACSRLCVIVVGLVSIWVEASAQDAVPSRELGAPPRRELLPRPEWQAPGPLMADTPGAQMPGGDPFQLLENSKEVQDDLHLTQEQISRIAIAARHFQTKLQELSYPRPGVSKEAAQVEIQRHVMEARGTIARELTPFQLIRLQQIMLQLEGPCLMVIDPQAGRQLAVTNEQVHAIDDACRERAMQMRNAVQSGSSPQTPDSREAFCAAMLSSRDQVEQVRMRANQQIVALLSPEQRAMLERLEGRKLSLPPPIPPYCH